MKIDTFVFSFDIKEQNQVKRTRRTTTTKKKRCGNIVGVHFKYYDNVALCMKRRTDSIWVVAAG